MRALLSSLSLLERPRVLVVGDVMLDRYTWGDAERVSPEAPVLVLRADECEVRLGGAASVARLLRGLEADVTLAGVIGDDASGRTVRKLLDEAQVDAALIVVDPARPTTVKERFLGRAANRHAHQILRVDTESRTPLDDALAETMARDVAVLVPHHSAVLISDYAKGTCTPELVSSIIAAGRAAGVPVLVDPARGADYERYRGATLLKPNRLEAELALGRSIASPAEALHAARTLRERYNFDAVVITLDRDGLVFATAQEAEHQPITPRAVYDITGAGDMVLAMLGLCHAARLPLRVAAQLANVAAGLEVRQPGVMPVSRDEIRLELERLSVSSALSDHSTASGGCQPIGSCSSSVWNGIAENTKTTIRLTPDARRSVPAAAVSKLVTLDEAIHVADEYRRAGRTIVFTNGCFDLLHVGHVRCLEEARQHGDVLFVAINSDASVGRLKGPDRPVISQHDRARMLASLACIDHVLIFDDPTPHRLLHAIRPDVLVKGGTTTDIVGREVVEAYGGRVVQTSEVPDRSTTALVSRLQWQSHPATCPQNVRSPVLDGEPIPEPFARPSPGA